MTRKWSIFQLFNLAVLALIGFCTLYPFIYIVAYSLNDGMDSMKGGIYFWPRSFTLGNYSAVFQDTTLIAAYKITIFRTLLGTVFHVILCATFAYALTKRTLPGRMFFIFMIFLPTLFPAGLIPNFILFRNLHIMNTFWVYILPFLYSFWNIIIIRTFFQQLPEALEESAKIDGCSDMGIFWRIIFPLSGPVLATIALFIGVFHWNDWFTGTFYVSKESIKPVQTLLQDLLTNSEVLASAASKMNSQGGGTMYSGMNQTTPESLRMATLVVATLPIICVYPFLQKYFVKGVMVGSVKG
ncbi:Trehalose transport system permease protein SugB [compost metagenome]